MFEVRLVIYRISSIRSTKDSPSARENGIGTWGSQTHLTASSSASIGEQRGSQKTCSQLVQGLVPPDSLHRFVLTANSVLWLNMMFIQLISWSSNLLKFDCCLLAWTADKYDKVIDILSCMSNNRLYWLEIQSWISMASSYWYKYRFSFIYLIYHQFSYTHLLQSMPNISYFACYFSGYK